MENGTIHHIPLGKEFPPNKLPRVIYLGEKFSNGFLFFPKKNWLLIVSSCQFSPFVKLHSVPNYSSVLEVWKRQPLQIPATRFFFVTETSVPLIYSEVFFHHPLSVGVATVNLIIDRYWGVRRQHISIQASLSNMFCVFLVWRGNVLVCSIAWSSIVWQVNAFANILPVAD